MLHIKNPQDFGAAMLMLFFGLGGLWFGRHFGLGTAAHMGPGYMPLALSAGLVIFGTIIGLRALSLHPGGKRGPAIEHIGVRTNLLILAAILAFALLIRTAGLAAATASAIWWTTSSPSPTAKASKKSATGSGL